MAPSLVFRAARCRTPGRVTNCARKGSHVTAVPPALPGPTGPPGWQLRRPLIEVPCAAVRPSPARASLAGQESGGSSPEWTYRMRGVWTPALRVQVFMY